MPCSILPGRKSSQQTVLNALLCLLSTQTRFDVPSQQCLAPLQEAHLNGMACVIECAQEDAERYCEGLRGNGLMASVEPAGGGGDSKPTSD